MPKISVIMPAFKRRFLREAIASVLAQTFRDFELVVVDDASPENLREIVDGFSDPRLTYRRNAANLGGADLTAAFNHALEFARGEWCLVAGDDDVYRPECLEKLLALAAEFPSCELVHARCAYIDESGAQIEVAAPRARFESQVRMAYERGVRRAHQQMGDFMFKTDAMRRIGGFVSFPLAWYTDDATWMLLARNGCAHLSEAMFCFRRSGYNVSSCDERLHRQKVEAGIAYDRWMRAFVRTLEPVPEEAELMAELADGIGQQVCFGSILFELCAIRALDEWCRAMLLPGLDPEVKAEATRRRFTH